MLVVDGYFVIELFRKICGVVTRDPDDPLFSMPCLFSFFLCRGDECRGDECRLCGMDGTLLCCDGCPPSYHSRCIGVTKMFIPQGAWYCPECTINKFGPKITRGTTLKAAEIFGADVYGQGVEVDLFLLQCCAALAPADLYVERILERYGLSKYLLLNLDRSSEYEPILVQEMISLIIQIVKEMRFWGLSNAECLRRELAFKLSVGDATHSQLVKSLPRDLSKN